MPKLICLSGLQGSGKSTFAKNWVAENPSEYVRINWDELRIELFGPDWKFNREEENKMKAISFKRAEDALMAGKDVIIDNTNLTERTRRSWEGLAKSMKVGYEQIEIDTPVAECVRRDRLREGKARVGRALIERNALFYGYIDWSDRSVYPRDFIIVDMDGTIADCDWRRKLAFQGPTKHKFVARGKGMDSIPCSLSDKIIDRQCPECNGKPKKDWDLFYQGVEKDPVIQPIMDLVTTLSGWGATNSKGEADELDVLVVSGRPLDKAGFGTEKWLEDNATFPVTHLFMRNRNDHRHDFIIKQEILDLLPKDRIRYVLEDRDQVVEMWRRNGLTCLQVADGKF